MEIGIWRYCHQCKGHLDVRPGFGTRFSGWEIGTPLITCKECNAINVSENTCEWKQCSLLRQLILICIYIGYGTVLWFVVSSILEKWHLDVPGVGVLIVLIPVGRLIYLINQSNKRMKDPAYVQLLKEHGALDLYETGSDGES